MVSFMVVVVYLMFFYNQPKSNGSMFVIGVLVCDFNKYNLSKINYDIKDDQDDDDDSLTHCVVCVIC